jgi:hypothetical protein
MLRKEFILSFIFALCISTILIGQKRECIELNMAYARKDAIGFEKKFGKCLPYDSCVIKQISLIVSKISNDSFIEFDISCLSIINKISDGYASEFLYNSMDKIFMKNHDKFLLASFRAQQKHKGIDISTLIIEAYPFIEYDILSSIRQLSKKQKDKNPKFAIFLNKIANELSSHSYP